MVRPEREVHQSIWELLKNLRGLDPLKQVFWSQLNYQRVNEPISRRGWGQLATESLAEDPVLFATGGSDNSFHVIYARLDSPDLRLGMERPVVSRLLQEHPYSLFIFSNKRQDHWHFVNVKLGEDHQKRRLFRRITIGPLERLRTASERVAMLDLASINLNLFGISTLEIQNRHDQAFDVESVTKQFYEEYKAVFNLLRDDLGKQTRDEHWAHDYALQFLNRCMFLYFVQRKGWLGDDAEFLGAFWNAYNKAGQPNDTFFSKWLSVLFFEAFNNKFHGGHKHFPDTVRDALQMAPFLNGGLFSENDLDHQYDFDIADVRFKQIFTFLERYNFTIAEDSPLDQEVAVDPEMIGKVYESLVNLSEEAEEADERGDAGIFYTPRTEIDLMCRLALVDNLANHLGDKHKNLFYEAVFAIQLDEKQCADAGLAKAKLWPAVDEHLQRITVADLACGSGSFLVGMLHILDDLRARAAGQVGRKESPYDRKKGIIGRSLYGVDVMEWACHVAELRLWLALIIDVEMSREELHVRQEPLLPHFSFKIRCGDSLVQEVGGISLSRRRGNMDIPKVIKDRLRKLQNAKLAFFNNEVPGADYDREKKRIESDEVVIFRDLLGNRAAALDEEAKKLMRIQAEKPATQRNLLTGEADGPARQMSLAHEEREKQIADLMEEVAALKQQQAALRHPKDVPLVWDIAFAEVMESDTGGFDIVVGNPPYVRQESIAAPIVSGRQVTEDKKEYKAMLARSVYQAWPAFFGYKANSEKPARKINAKSDLYVYFYFHGLSLLNTKGSFCFITSNSWLDVAYGADLQEFLLRHGHVKMVIDNQAKRSFASADINTVIALLSRPDDHNDGGLSHTARFIMFKVPFEQALSPILYQEIEETRHRKSTAEYRLFSLTQLDLFHDGCMAIKGDDDGETATPHRRSLLEAPSYGPNKWGGKYLRAPEIYWAIKEKASDRLVPLRELGDVRRGLTTGANDFFFVRVASSQDGVAEIVCDDDSIHRIEEEFVTLPVIVKARELRRPHLTLSDVSYKLVSLNDVTGRHRFALSYIKRGERLGYHERPTLRVRDPWYRIDVRSAADILIPIGHKRRPVVAISPNACASDNLVEVRLHNPSWRKIVAGSVLSAFTLMVYEIAGRANFGQGLLKTQTYELGDLPVLDPRTISTEHLKHFGACFDRVATREPLMFYDEVRREDRRALDEAYLEALGFSDSRQRRLLVSELQNATCQMIWSRMAKSDTAREARQSFDDWYKSGLPFALDEVDEL